MNRFSITSFKYNTELFKTKTIYLIKDEDTEKYIGKSFSSQKRAQYVCDWINHVQQEYDDYGIVGE